MSKSTMKALNIICSSVFQVLSIVFVLGYLLGVLNLHFSDKNDYCIMTYMYEYPQFVRISLPESSLYPQYGLYAYSEGRFTERARRMWFDGVPVLFLPGNAGSHMQARSIASVALRKAISKGHDFHFDFFTISYNEELSGLYGGVLQSQTKFAAACVAKILSFYKINKYTKSVPSSVILIGHSMGGLIAKRLLANPITGNTTNIAITLAAPLEAPVINFDVKMDYYYMRMDLEWQAFVNGIEEMKQKKLLISFGNGPRDILVPSALTSSKDSYINALTTAVPGVWVSPDHVSIVWCKQLVMAINRYLFSIVDPNTQQIFEDQQVLRARAKQYFQANRSMILSNEINRANVTMVVDAFWYEDNRRIYQVTRPEIDKTTYLMIRLVRFPQNRFVAVEAVNVDDRDWIFGCNAKYAYSTYRYCKKAVSLSELSRRTGAALNFGKRKLATVHLHSLMKAHPDWTHVIVRVSPTRKPITLNVDINDHASRQIFVDLPSEFSFGNTVIKEETEQDSLYYELILRDFNILHQAYLLYVEPTAGCKAQYHVSAEVHVPWASNSEYYHYFTHLKRSPMKLRLFKSNPNATAGMEATEHVKVTLLLDPQCRYTISISSSWYQRLAQFVRNYTPELLPYVAAIVLLAVRSSILNLSERGTYNCVHSALMSECVKPYYTLMFARLGSMIFMSVPLFSYFFEDASWKNIEIVYFTRSLLVIPAYMTALGIVNITATALLAVMVFSSQIVHRLFLRIVFRGGSGVGEKIMYGVQKVPIAVSVVLMCASRISCGAAALVVGAAYYGFKLSKIYEEYLEDYFYKLMSKIASRICRMITFKNRNIANESESSLISKSDSDDSNIQENLTGLENESNVVNKENDKPDLVPNKDVKKDGTDLPNPGQKRDTNDKENVTVYEVDLELNHLNFHFMMFLMWMIVTVVNVPALLTWARNFKYSMNLKPDTSYDIGVIMATCLGIIWQKTGPRLYLRYYEAVANLIFIMAVFILIFGPLSLTIVNYGVTFIFFVITIQQTFDKDEYDIVYASDEPEYETQTERSVRDEEKRNQENNGPNIPEEPTNAENITCDEEVNSSKTPDDCDVCSESRIYTIFRNLREKFSYNENL